jgi:protein subunit release factor A
MFDESDLKIDVFRGSGPPGSAHRWAVRVTHIPSGASVATQGEAVTRADSRSAIDEARAGLLVELEAKVREVSGE